MKFLLLEPADEFIYLTIMKNSLIFIFLTVTAIHSEHVLVLQPFSPRSHRIIVEPIARALGSRGHHVTFVSPFKYDGEVPPNVTEIAFPQFIESFELLEVIVVDTIRIGWMPSVLRKYYNMHVGLCHQLYESGLLQQWTAKNKKFKVVLLDAVFTECILPLWRNFAEYIILINTSVFSPTIVGIMNLPVPYSIVPYIIPAYSQYMNFMQRCINSAYWLLNSYYNYLNRKVFYENIILPSFPDTKPNDQTLTNISLVLVNEDPVFSAPRPYLPNIILVGGIQCHPGKPLPEDDLKAFVDGSGDNGFILVSFGSIIRGNFMSDDLKRTLVTVFGQLKQRVIWKYESELNGLPDNVKVVKWFPQNDLLGHPKIRTFINQGGLNSVQESVYHAVPQVCFPMTSDQPQLVNMAEEFGIAIKLDFNTVTVEQLVDAIEKATSDPEIKKQVQYYSDLFRFRDEPLDTAIHWIELVMKFNGALHLQSADLNIIQYYLLDVYAVYFLILVSILVVIWFGIKKIVTFTLRPRRVYCEVNGKAKYL